MSPRMPVVLRQDPPGYGRTFVPLHGAVAKVPTKCRSGAGNCREHETGHCDCTLLICLFPKLQVHDLGSWLTLCRVDQGVELVGDSPVAFLRGVLVNEHRTRARVAETGHQFLRGHAWYPRCRRGRVVPEIMWPDALGMVLRPRHETDGGAGHSPRVRKVLTAQVAPGFRQRPAKPTARSRTSTTSRFWGRSTGSTRDRPAGRRIPNVSDRRATATLDRGDVGAGRDWRVVRQGSRTRVRFRPGLRRDRCSATLSRSGRSTRSRR